MPTCAGSEPFSERCAPVSKLLIIDRGVDARRLSQALAGAGDGEGIDIFMLSSSPDDRRAVVDALHQAGTRDLRWLDSAAAVNAEVTAMRSRIGAWEAELLSAPDGLALLERLRVG